MKFHRKREGRIYTDKPENIDKIKKIMKEMDEFEYDYLPKNFIAVFNGKIELVYNGKFDDLDLNELMERCWQQDIYVFCAMD